MRRLLCLIFALCLPLTALAETVPERVGAPATWQGEFLSNTGLTHVYVDMTIEVPEVNAIPIYAVKQHVFTMEEITRFADLMLGDGQWHQTSYDTDHVEGEPRYLTGEYAGDAGILYYCDLENDERQSVYADYAILKAMPHWYILPSLSFSTPFERHFGRNICAEEEAIAMANTVVERLAPDMHLDGINPQKDGKYMSHRTGNRNGDDYGHRLYYERSVDGIRITSVAQQGAEDAEELHNPVLPYEKLWIDVGEKGIFDVHWENPIDITGMIEEDCELLPFDKIMDIFGTIAPLTIQNTEYERNNNLYIDHAVLGYMCLQKRGDPTDYRLVPVWDFFGERTIGPERYGKRGSGEDYDLSLLTINAIDGTIIDRTYGY